MKFGNFPAMLLKVKGVLLIIVLVALLAVGAKSAVVSAQSTTTCKTGMLCIYLPAVVTSPSGDLALYGMEVTQAVQDASNSVPLVAGRAAMLRIYARTEGVETPLSNVRVSVSASTSSSLLSGSPSTYAATVPLSYDRTRLETTINIPLPPNWTSGTVDLTVRLDPDDVIRELDESNNTITRRFVFQAVAPLRVKIVPVQYANTSDGYTYPAPTRDSISGWIQRTYPVSKVEVSWRAPLAFSGNLGTQPDFIRLLNEVTALRSLDGAPADQVYYALVPTSNGYRTWFYGGIAGIGWIGMRAAVGLDAAGTAGQIAAHEIGHNLGLYHSPCGYASSPDPNYPYADGIIGQTGLDLTAGTLYTPTARDFMSYCSPKWVSDYTYTRLFNMQRLASGAVGSQMLSLPAEQPAGRGLLLRALVDEAGARLEPAYIVPGPVTPSPAAGDYRVELLDDGGQLIATAPVAAYEIELEDQDAPALYGINALIPLPEQPAAAFRLVHAGEVLAEQTLQAGAAPALNGAQGPAPALLRYSQDGGTTWTTAGLDLSPVELQQYLDLLGEDTLTEVILADSRE